MSAKYLGLTILGVFFFITILGFFTWVGIITIVWLGLSFFRVSTNLWAMIEALSTALAAAAVFSAGFVAYKEISEASISRHMEVADRLFNELNSVENIEARRWIFQNLANNPEEGLRSMSQEGHNAVKRVLNSLDHVAFLTQAEWIPEEIIMPWMHPMIAKSWEKLEPYVLYERIRREEPYYYQQIDRLAKRCSDWRKTHLISQSIKWVNDAL